MSPFQFVIGGNKVACTCRLLCLICLAMIIIEINCFHFGQRLKSDIPRFISNTNSITRTSAQSCRRPFPATDVSVFSIHGGKGELQQNEAVTGEARQVLPPRPDLPALSISEQRMLMNGQRVQKQFRQGKEGMGVAVVDLKADEETLWAVLTNFRRYPAMIPTIRDGIMFSERKNTAKVEYLLSRFKLPVRCIMQYKPEKSMLEFELDPDCKTSVFKSAVGFWFCEPSPNRPGYVRVWLKGEVVCSKLVPGFIVDYGAAKALPRASEWLKPMVEAEFKKRQRLEGR